jgi:hypothetical protein
VNLALGLGLGLVLLAIGFGMVFVALPNRHGIRRVSVPDSLTTVYPAICLAFIVFGVAMLVST